MVSARDLDASVKTKRRNCRPVGICDSDIPIGRPPPTVTNAPETSKFVGLSLPPYVRPSVLHNYETQKTDLVDRLGRVQVALSDYEYDIAHGSTSGIGRYLPQGDKLIRDIEFYIKQTETKKEVHNALTINELRALYLHYTGIHEASGVEHPIGQPKQPISSVKSKSAIIEDLVELYEIPPEDLLTMASNMGMTPNPSSPAPMPLLVPPPGYSPVPPYSTDLPILPPVPSQYYGMSPGSSQNSPLQ